MYLDKLTLVYAELWLNPIPDIIWRQVNQILYCLGFHSGFFRVVFLPYILLYVQQ